MPMMDGYWYGSMWLVMALFWIVVIAGVVWLALTLSRQQGRGGGDGSALRILEERLARGDIDVEEYRARRSALEETARR